MKRFKYESNYINRAKKNCAFERLSELKAQLNFLAVYPISMRSTEYKIAFVNLRGSQFSPLNGRSLLSLSLATFAVGPGD